MGMYEDVWASASECHLNSLFFLQKKIIRIMTFSPYLAHTDPIFKDPAILFKVEYEPFPISVIQMFSRNRDIHSHDTRNLLWVTTGTKNFSYLSARIWNAIVSKINISVFLSQFKYLLYLLHNTLVYTVYIPIQKKVNNYLVTVFSTVAWLLI